MPFKFPDHSSYQYSPITYTQNTYHPCTLLRVNVIKAGFTQTHNSKMHFDMHTVVATADHICTATLLVMCDIIVISIITI